MHGTLADGGLFSNPYRGRQVERFPAYRSISRAMQVISRSTNTSAFGGVDEDFIVTGAQGIASPWSISQSLRSTKWFPRGPAYRTGAAELGDLYVALSRDLTSGTQTVPTFHYAVWQQQLFEQIQDSSENR